MESFPPSITGDIVEVVREIAEPTEAVPGTA